MPLLLPATISGNPSGDQRTRSLDEDTDDQSWRSLQAHVSSGSDDDLMVYREKRLACKHLPDLPTFPHADKHLDRTEAL